MKIHLVNTAHGLFPESDDDYDAKKHLKIGETYLADISLVRNPKFHRLFFALINTAWEYLPERQAEGFRTKDTFRKYIIAAAGFVEPFYSPKTREWVEIPKSMSFGSMKEDEFKELYERCKDVIFAIIGRFVTKEEFEKNLINF